MGSSAIPSVKLVSRLPTKLGILSRATLVIVAAAWSHRVALGDSAYSITDLGTLGGTYIYVSGINHSGEVVGNATTNGTTGMHAFIYSAGTLLDLGTLGGTNSYGYAINDSNQVVGAAYTSSGQDDAFLYQDAAMSNLGTLGGTGSDARAINNNGQVTGGAWTVGNTEYHAYLYSGGIKTDLGTLGGARSAAFGINDRGQVVGRAALRGSTPQHAFLYAEGTMRDLGTFGGMESWAYSINNFGEVVGGADTSTNTEHAFLYSAGTMIDLGTLGGAASRAYRINNRGEIVGFSFTTNLTQHAFVFPAGGTMTDLNTLIDTNTGWTLEVATAVNDKGQIAGIGTHPAGRLRAFLLTPALSLQIHLGSSNSVQIQFMAQPNTGYVLEYRDALSSGAWEGLVLDPLASYHTVLLTETLDPQRPARFYRVRNTAPATFEAANEGANGISSMVLNSTVREQLLRPLEQEVGKDGVKDGKRVAPFGPLSAQEAGALAQRLANQRAESLYQVRPFRKAQSARLVEARWVWRQRRGFGAADIEAKVEFAVDGADPKVEVTLLDSRVSVNFR